MRVLVTGGKGTLGRGLVEELGSRGYEVVSADLAHGAEEIGFSLRTGGPRRISRGPAISWRSWSRNAHSRCAKARRDTGRISRTRPMPC